MPTNLGRDKPIPDSSRLTYPGMALALLHSFQQNANLHRAIVAAGRFEFLLHCARTDVYALGGDTYQWVWEQLVQSKPPEIHELPDGTILNDQGHVVPPTADDLAMARSMGLRKRTPRVFLTDAG